MKEASLWGASLRVVEVSTTSSQEQDSGTKTSNFLSGIQVLKYPTSSLLDTKISHLLSGYGQRLQVLKNLIVYLTEGTKMSDLRD